MEDKWQARFGGAANADSRDTIKADTWPMQGGHMADICGQGLEARPKRTPGGHKADTWWIKCGGAAKAESRRTQGGHKADTCGRGRGQSISRPAFFI